MKPPRRLAFALTVMALGVTAATGGTAEARYPIAVAAADHPNVILFLLDDATAADVEYMPNAQALLVQQGATFEHNYSSFPLCCPARASILSGLYPHNHRVLGNIRPFGGFKAFDDSATIATWLQDDYQTALIGKYLNDYREGRYVPPGWDLWSAVIPPTTYDYMNPTINMDGTLHSFSDTYVTDLYGQLAQDFLHEAAGPLFLYASYIAPHNGKPHEDDDPTILKSPFAAPKYQNTYTGPGLPDDPSFNEADVSDKPQFVQRLPLLTPEKIAAIAEVTSQRREALRSVDDQIAATIKAVAAAGQLDDTYFILTSDNGYMSGQHRIAEGKWVLYEPSARVPLIIRGPGITPGSHYDGVSGLQDIAPTILDMTNEWNSQTIPKLDGRSLLPLLAGTETTRRVQLLERVKTDGFSDEAIDQGKVKSAITGITWVNRGLVTSSGWKYIEYPVSGEVEMYYLKTDPYEEQNLAGDPAFANKQSRLSATLARFKQCDGAQCR